MSRRRPFAKYLGRRLLDGPYLALCQSERKFHRECRALDSGCELVDFMSKHANATTHFIEAKKGRGLIALVCIAPSPEGRSPSQVVALLAHEATHVWRRYCQRIGESEPGVEIEAYAIQSITQELVHAYRPRLQFATPPRRIKARRRKVL